MSSPGKRWRATAPSNIALIKYMGKIAGQGNLPANTSISYSLSHLRSIVELELTAGADSWEPLREFEGRALPGLALSERGLGRFLAHLAFLKKHFEVEWNFIVRSANDFPSDCGLASSASSFAALTMAACEAMAELSAKPPPSREAASDLARQGSGSSCRSFFTAWAVWDEAGAREIEVLRDLHLDHQVIVVDAGVKSVSSSEAHRRVITSAQFAGRPGRAQGRATELIAALAESRWADAFETTWAEFWDMHALFETSRPSFGYMNAGTLEVLRWVRENSWDRNGRGPLVTMDAGPNVHLFHLRDENGRALAGEITREFNGRYQVLSSGSRA